MCHMFNDKPVDPFVNIGCIGKSSVEVRNRDPRSQCLQTVDGSEILHQLRLVVYIMFIPLFTGYKIHPR